MDKSDHEWIELNLTDVERQAMLDNHYYYLCKFAEFTACLDPTDRGPPEAA